MTTGKAELETEVPQLNIEEWGSYMLALERIWGGSQAVNHRNIYQKITIVVPININLYLFFMYITKGDSKI